MVLYSAQSGTWQDLKKFDHTVEHVSVWSSDSKSIYFVLIDTRSSGDAGVYRLTSSQTGKWELIYSNHDGLNC